MLTHALFDSDTFLYEVEPNDLNSYPDDNLVALPDDYWQRPYAWQGRTAIAQQLVAPPLIMSRLGYQRLFTQAERIAVRGSPDPIVIDFRELAALAEDIDLGDPDVVLGLQYLTAVGLLGDGRAAMILAGDMP